MTSGGHSTGRPDATCTSAFAMRGGASQQANFTYLQFRLKTFQCRLLDLSPLLLGPPFTARTLSSGERFLLSPQLSDVALL